VADDYIVNESDLKMWEVIETWNHTRIFEVSQDHINLRRHTVRPKDEHFSSAMSRLDLTDFTPRVSAEAKQSDLETV
jgi:hypothetical protein